MTQNQSQWGAALTASHISPALTERLAKQEDLENLSERYEVLLGTCSELGAEQVRSAAWAADAIKILTDTNKHQNQILTSQLANLGAQAMRITSLEGDVRRLQIMVVALMLLVVVLISAAVL